MRQAVLHGVKDRPTNERAMLLQLTTFVRIADAGNISRAARSLGLSVPMASRHLRWLEEELGVPLMRRTTHRLDLTEAGTELVARARVILASVEEAREIVRPGPGVAGHVVVSAPVSFGVHRLSPLLPSLFEKHPRLRVEIRLEDHVVDLRAVQRRNPFESRPDDERRQIIGPRRLKRPPRSLANRRPYRRNNHHFIHLNLAQLTTNN